MAKKYTLHYLSDKEFDNLPYKHVKTSFGCADEKSGNAYVRRTGIRPIDEFVSEHEIAELVAKVSPHETDGIRYKGGPIGWIQDVMGDVGNTIQTTLNRMGPIGEAIGQGGVGVTSGSNGTQVTTGGTAGTGRDLTYGGNQNTNNGAPAPIGGSGPAQTPVTGSLGANTSTINQPSTGGLNQAFENYQSNQLGFANTPVKMGGTTANVSPNLSTINTSASAPQTSWSSPNSIANMFTTSQNQNKSLGTPVSLGNQNYNVTGGTEGLKATPTSTNTATASSLGFETPAVNTPYTAEGLGSTYKTGQGVGANVPLQTINQAAASPSIQTGGETSTNQVKKEDTTSTTPWLDDIFGKDWRQTLLGQGIKTGAGLLTAGIGQAMAGKPQTVNPQDSALFNQVVERVQSGTQVEMTPAQRQAIEYNYDQQLENARKNIIARFKSLRPGSDIANDSQLQQALTELEADFAEQKATAMTAAQLGLTETQTAQLSQLAAYDINSLATSAGISNQEAADFKKMMADFGGMIATGNQRQQIVYTQ